VPDPSLPPIRNDGPEGDGEGDADAGATEGGVGMANLRSRLQILHGDRSALELRRAAAGGAEVVEVVVRLPYTEA